MSTRPLTTVSSGRPRTDSYVLEFLQLPDRNSESRTTKDEMFVTIHSIRPDGIVFQGASRKHVSTEFHRGEEWCNDNPGSEKDPADWQKRIGDLVFKFYDNLRAESSSVHWLEGWPSSSKQFGSGSDRMTYGVVNVARSFATRLRCLIARDDVTVQYGSGRSVGNMTSTDYDSHRFMYGYACYPSNSSPKAIAEDERKAYEGLRELFKPKTNAWWRQPGGRMPLLAAAERSRDTGNVPIQIRNETSPRSTASAAPIAAYFRGVKLALPPRPTPATPTFDTIIMPGDTITMSGNTITTPSMVAREEGPSIESRIPLSHETACTLPRVCILPPRNHQISMTYLSFHEDTTPDCLVLQATFSIGARSNSERSKRCALEVGLKEHAFSLDTPVLAQWIMADVVRRRWGPDRRSETVRDSTGETRHPTSSFQPNVSGSSGANGERKRKRGQASDSTSIDVLGTPRGCVARSLGELARQLTLAFYNFEAGDGTLRFASQLRPTVSAQSHSETHWTRIRKEGLVPRSSNDDGANESRPHDDHLATTQQRKLIGPNKTNIDWRNEDGQRIPIWRVDRCPESYDPVTEITVVRSQRVRTTEASEEDVVRPDSSSFQDEFRTIAD